VFDTTLTSLDEQTLIAHTQHGDRQAFGELVRRHQNGVVNVVYRMCGDLALSEEAAQEAFIRAWQNIQRYKPMYAFRNWVYRIAINAALDVIRSEPVTNELDDQSLTSTEEDPETSVERKERSRQVQQAVLALPAASRAVLILREYEGLSYQEIANALDIPVGTVMSRLNYARGQVRQALSKVLEAV